MRQKEEYKREVYFFSLSEFLDNKKRTKNKQEASKKDLDSLIQMG